MGCQLSESRRISRKIVGSFLPGWKVVILVVVFEPGEFSPLTKVEINNFTEGKVSFHLQVVGQVT